MIKLVRIVCLLLPAMLLGGCSLAVPDAGEHTKEDQMIGAYITREALEAYDMDAFFTDNRWQVADGKQFTQEDLSGYQNRLFAQIEKNGSENPSEWNVSFPGSKGICFFAPLWDSPDGSSYRDNVIDAQVCERDFSVSASDEEETLGLTGTIYVTPYETPNEQFHFYVNPVYQNPDGEIYVLHGSGYLMQTAGTSVEGEQVMTTLTDERSMTADDTQKKEKTSVTVKFEVIYRPISVTLCEMDARHHLLKKKVYQPGKIPKKLRAQEGTAYILVETEKESPIGETVVSREICEYTREMEGVLESFYAAEDGIVRKKDTEVVWGRN